MLSLTFLGTAATIPTADRNLPAIAIKNRETYLFDCGEGTQRQMIKFKVGYGKVKAIFISHLHLDHFLGIFGLLETLRLSDRKEKLFLFVPRGFKFYQLERYPFLEISYIKEGLLLDNGEATISAFKTHHEEESYGFVYEEKERIKFNAEKAHALGIKGILFKKIQEEGYLKIENRIVKLEDISWVKKGKKIVYTSDTLPSEKIISIAKNSNILIHDSTFSNEHSKEAKERFHSTALEAARIAKEANVELLILTHFSNRYKDVKILLEEAKKVFSNTIAAFDGLKIEVK